MKRKALLIMLLMAMVAPLAMNAQGLTKTLNATQLQGQTSLETLQTREAGWLEYETDSIVGIYGLGLPSYTYGVMFPSDMLDDNNTLSAVAFVQSASMTGDVIINIYSGGTSAPGTLVHTETYATTGETNWQTVELSDVYFDPAENLWITLSLEGGTGVGACPFGYSPEEDPNASWFNYNGNWYDINDLLGEEGWIWLIAGYVENTTISCATPTNLQASNITTSTADLSWSSIGEETAWQIAYSTQSSFNPDNATPINVTARTYTLTDLTDDTDYYVYVRSNCGDGAYSAWSEMLEFTTPWVCDKPYGVTVSNITSSSADLGWTGYDDSYDVRYRTYPEHDTENFTQLGNDVTTTSSFADYTFNVTDNISNAYIAIRHYNCSDQFLLDVASVTVKDRNGNSLFTADFTTGIPDGWHTIDKDGDGFNWNAAQGFVYSESYSNELYEALNPDNWLVSPMISSLPRRGTIVVNAKGQDEQYYAEVFGLYYSTTALPEYEWNIVENNSGSNYTINNLETGVTYEAQVKAHSCDDADWCHSVTFTTIANLFNTDGNWNDASNWLLGEVPATGADVTIAANCTIPAGYTANAGAITIGENGSLTIQDGGQLIHTNEGVVATMEKEIKGYTGEKDSYYFIASPANTVFTYNGNTYTYTDPAEVENMLSNEYDLYGFDCTKELEWRNYEADAENFVMWQGMGYLYANSGEKTTLKFTGELIPFESTFANNYSLLTYEASDENFNGFNLVGNMFAADAYIVIADYDSENNSITGLSEDVYFYTMGDGELVAGTGAVAPMQGVMVQASSDSQVALCFTQALRSNKALNINLSHSHGLLDAAYIRFNGGSELSKIQLNPNHTKVFFTKDNQDYAVVNSEAQGEMPVSFKAESNGTYTLSINTENVELGYLHLIDNLTGKDVDLLSNPSYTFEAKSTDYANRFKLVFATGNADDNFAFYSNGSFVINNEGIANIQVMDINGRIISSESINGCTNLNVNAAPGVYMIRLVNGDNVKVQKVVVK